MRQEDPTDALKTERGGPADRDNVATPCEENGMDVPADSLNEVAGGRGGDHKPPRI